MRFVGSAALRGPVPAWMSATLATDPWGVVRRAAHPPGFVPVGMRGPGRRQWHTALVPVHAITCVVPPEELTGRRPRLVLLGLILTAAAHVLSIELDGAAWGPIGGVGYELATGRAATHPGSDLDLLVRTPHPLARDEAARLVTSFTALPGRIDCQMETPSGGVSLTAWARPHGPVLTRTPDGPRLLDDPWTCA
ncbi:malonate decarboxylase holo-ACP synthase [Sphaerisporangium rubeum]|uniref:Phosphoribosyl-dephospho-CoA transferase n=1 Tax=Sphaerisporangium rubeum TaxID=321317 RepID=A0A7X0IKH6_9ACTN|nr:phosphoribosyl-dephospho-CoA transferase [Sphaerisporangium rubeum]